MAKRNARRFRRRRRSKRKRNRKAVKMSVKRVAKIATKAAKKVHQADEIRLISRKYLWSDYDKLTNEHDSGSGLAVSFSGVVVPLCEIPVADVEFMIAQTVLDIPESKMDESLGGQAVDFGSAGAPGSGIGTIDVPRHGYRLGPSIKAKAFSVQLRLNMEKLEDGELGRVLDNAILYWKIVYVRSDELLGQQSWEPTADRCLRINSWGFSAKLDQIESNVSSNFRCRTLLRGSTSIHPRTSGMVQKNISRFVSLKKPILLTYGKMQATVPPTITVDMTGQFPLKGQCFLILRSNVPDSYDDRYKIKVSAVTKFFYTDN